MTSCKGINRGEGYVYPWSEDINYVKITISDTEYIHFYEKLGIGEWVNGTDISLISIGSVYQPIRNADAYRMFAKRAEMIPIYLDCFWDSVFPKTQVQNHFI